MMCEKLRADFMEAVLSGPETASPQLQEHLRSCAACARELASFQQTMSVLDEWQAPEPSPYFSSRLRARMREADGRATSRLAGMVAETGGGNRGCGVGCGRRWTFGDGPRESRQQHPGDQRPARRGAYEQLPPGPRLVTCNTWTRMPICSPISMLLMGNPQRSK